jgi:hypothetical protein
MYVSEKEHIMTNSESNVTFIGSREVRVVPKGWTHPVDARGRHIPLLPAGYAFDDEQDASTPMMPSAMHLPDNQTEIMAYETVSEGTPISPAFPNNDDGRIALVNYCAEHATTFGDHRASGEAWAAILFGDAAIGIDGTVHG